MVEAVRPITDDVRHEAALREIEALWDAPPGSPEHERLDVLATLVDAYETRRWPRIAELDPADFLREHMSANGLELQDLAAVVDSQQLASDLISRKRPLTLEQIRALSRSWRVPGELLIREYELA